MNSHLKKTHTQPPSRLASSARKLCNPRPRYKALPAVPTRNYSTRAARFRRVIGSECRRFGGDLLNASAAVDVGVITIIRRGERITTSAG